MPQPSVRRADLLSRVGTLLSTGFNSRVPQHVIQRLLCDASPEMTNFHAHLHDTTIRAELERYCQTRVDIDGKLLGFDPRPPGTPNGSSTGCPGPLTPSPTAIAAARRSKTARTPTPA